MRISLLAFPLMLIAVPAAAQERDFCANRPGLGTPACTMAPGQTMVELGLAGWDHTSDATGQEDDWTWGDALSRVGIDQRTELELGFGGYAANRFRDPSSRLTTRVHGVGDVTLAIRRSISGPDGPVAVHGYVTLPTGKTGVGAGDWSAGLLLPTGFALPGGFGLDLSPELDISPDSAGSGHHAIWGGVAGVGHSLGKSLALEGELGAWCDEDPSGQATDARAALSLAWQARRDWQLDFEIDLGLTSAAPHRSMAVGLAHRF